MQNVSFQSEKDFFFTDSEPEIQDSRINIKWSRNLCLFCPE